ncbi:hypothetical protein Taro_022183 [Colocasia esculenta]|uniref:Uncharacterized protein n=1 Tax=Colocasia esculenta TaxID=4460 RepID=A0A843V7M5_COLES|nr:hypothetical protein [Colocasia esculenta]
MKEASNSSPLFSPETPNAGAAAAAAAPAERQVMPALRVKTSCCAGSLSSVSTSSSSSSSSVRSSNDASLSFYSSHLGSPMLPSSPFSGSSSAIPFSWEKRPGVPKHSHRAKEHQRWAPGQRLPPPPFLRSNSDPFLSVTRKKRPELRLLADPFAVALMECSKGDRRDPEDGDSPGTFWKAAAASSKAIGGRRKTIADLLGFVDLYASCKTTSSVADSTVYIPRSGRPDMAAYGLLSRRAG